MEENETSYDNYQMKQTLREDFWSKSLMGKVCLLEVKNHTSSR